MYDSCPPQQPALACLLCSYLLGEFVKQPVACLTLASYLATNTGDVARKYIKVPYW